MSGKNDALDAAIDEVIATEYALTDAWTPLEPHDVQGAFVWHPARFKFAPAGRRSGKTELAKRDAVLSLLQDNGPHPMRIAICAPTYSRAKDIYLDDLLALIPPHWIKQPNGIKQSMNMMEIRTRWNSVIRLLGLKVPESIEGVPWDKVKADEIADAPEDCIEENVLPALETKNRLGSAWFYGVPDEAGDNQDEYERFWELGLRWPEDRDVCSFWWPSADILDEAQIEKLSARMDEQTFNQEFRGLFVRSGGKAFPNFSVLQNVDADMCAYAPTLPLDFSFDPGSATGAGLISQQYGFNLWVLDEVDGGGASTEVVGETMLERANGQGWSTHSIRVFGDPAGRTPSSPTAQSDYDVLRTDVFAGLDVEWNQLMGSVAIKDTVNILRALVRNRRGRVSLFIHPRCEKLIDNMKKADWPAKNKLREFHHLACLRYKAYALFGDTEQQGIVGTGRATIVGSDDARRFNSRIAG